MHQMYLSKLTALQAPPVALNSPGQVVLNDPLRECDQDPAAYRGSGVPYLNTFFWDLFLKGRNHYEITVYTFFSLVALKSSLLLAWRIMRLSKKGYKYLNWVQK